MIREIAGSGLCERVCDREREGERERERERFLPVSDAAAAQNVCKCETFLGKTHM